MNNQISKFEQELKDFIASQTGRNATFRRRNKKKIAFVVAGNHETYLYEKLKEHLKYSDTKISDLSVIYDDDCSTTISLEYKNSEEYYKSIINLTVSELEDLNNMFGSGKWNKENTINFAKTEI